MFTVEQRVHPVVLEKLFYSYEYLNQSRPPFVGFQKGTQSIYFNKRRGVAMIRRHELHQILSSG